MEQQITNQQSYTIRRKIFTLFGAAFHIYDEAGNLMAFSKQKAFKLKEDIRLYTDETCTTERLVIKATKVIDFSSAYEVTDPATGETLGVLKRKGFKSMLRDHWVMETADGMTIQITEDSALMAMVRRLLTNLFPQGFHAKTDTGALIASFKQNFNPFVQKLKMTFAPDTAGVDARLIIAAGVLLVAIEGRQK
ncbi:MAG: hypothetical protein HN909_06325 [Phycisphaerales bacterium]|jgi:uncharacterized protein YxjI|nr:hypothetical protein [Phycisphaerales bacterium]MBT7171368.1 hypothetical protein [Phycisphaerales bacterium]